ncbi:hypothetical protein FRB97_008532 [Tulasnella sp. 331]|nr:hypothetical protein FRB97_008532 [Tulasnella sp. 331]
MSLWFFVSYLLGLIEAGYVACWVYCTVLEFLLTPLSAPSPSSTPSTDPHISETSLPTAVHGLPPLAPASHGRVKVQGLPAPTPAAPTTTVLREAQSLLDEVFFEGCDLGEFGAYFASEAGINVPRDSQRALVYTLENILESQDGLYPYTAFTTLTDNTYRLNGRIAIHSPLYKALKALLPSFHTSDHLKRDRISLILSSIGRGVFRTVAVDTAMPLLPWVTTSKSLILARHRGRIIGVFDAAGPLYQAFRMLLFGSPSRQSNPRPLPLRVPPQEWPEWSRNHRFFPTHQQSTLGGFIQQQVVSVDDLVYKLQVSQAFSFKRSRRVFPKPIKTLRNYSPQALKEHAFAKSLDFITAELEKLQMSDIDSIQKAEQSGTDKVFRQPVLATPSLKIDLRLEPDVLFEGLCNLSQRLYPNEFVERIVTITRSRIESKLVSLAFTKPYGNQSVEDFVAYGGGSCRWADDACGDYIFAIKVYVDYSRPQWLRDWSKEIKVMVQKDMGGDFSRTTGIPLPVSVSVIPRRFIYTPNCPSPNFSVISTALKAAPTTTSATLLALTPSPYTMQTSNFAPLNPVAVKVESSGHSSTVGAVDAGSAQVPPPSKPMVQDEAFHNLSKRFEGEPIDSRNEPHLIPLPEDSTDFWSDEAANAIVTGDSPFAQPSPVSDVCIDVKPVNKATAVPENQQVSTTDGRSMAPTRKPRSLFGSLVTFSRLSKRMTGDSAGLGPEVAGLSAPKRFLEAQDHGRMELPVDQVSDMTHA